MQRFHHGKPSWNLTMIWTNQAEVFIPCKRVENNHVNGLKTIDYAPEFKFEKQIDECLI